MWGMRIENAGFCELGDETYIYKDIRNSVD